MDAAALRHMSYSSALTGNTIFVSCSLLCRLVIFCVNTAAAWGLIVVGDWEDAPNVPDRDIVILSYCHIVMLSPCIVPRCCYERSVRQWWSLITNGWLWQVERFNKLNALTSVSITCQCHDFEQRYFHSMPYKNTCVSCNIIRNQRMT